jgi:ABC-type nitrate/sulfonate/bicarbonate transport system substrate-binding protein
MKRILGPSLALFLLQTSVNAAAKIRISRPADAAHFTMHLAQKRGFLKEEGFDAELIIISGPVANVALSNGDTDYFSGYGSALRAILQGLPLRIVALLPPDASFHVADPA